MTEVRPDLPPLPPRIARLPVDARGYPVPWFVEWIDGKPEFRVMDGRKWKRAVEDQRCWICGEKLGTWKAFSIGPMCALNRVSAEPPSHLECAEFAARACPFLARPEAHRRENGLPDGAEAPAGEMICRNPGVSLVWVTKRYQLFWAPTGNQGYLIDIGQPSRALWFARGREATRDEVLASIESGYPALLKAAQEEGPRSVESLRARREEVENNLLPASEAGAA